MKFKITRQVPGPLRYEYAAFEIEGDTKEDADSETGAEYALAVAVANRWAEEQREKLTPAVLAGLSQEIVPPAPRPPAPTAAPRQAQPPPAQQRDPQGPPAAQPKAKEHLGPMGYPIMAYQDAVKWIIRSALRNMEPIAGSQYGPKQTERDFVRAASVNTNPNTGKTYFTLKNTMAEYAADIIGKFPQFGVDNVARTWERMEKFVKMLESDGHVTLHVPTWKDGAIAYSEINYSLAARQPGDDHASGHGMDEGGEPGDEGLPF